MGGAVVSGAVKIRPGVLERPAILPLVCPMGRFAVSGEAAAERAFASDSSKLSDRERVSLNPRFFGGKLMGRLRYIVTETS